MVQDKKVNRSSRFWCCILVALSLGIAGVAFGVPHALAQKSKKDDSADTSKKVRKRTVKRRRRVRRKRKRHTIRRRRSRHRRTRRLRKKRSRRHTLKKTKLRPEVRAVVPALKKRATPPLDQAEDSDKLAGSKTGKPTKALVPQKGLADGDVADGGSDEMVEGDPTADGGPSAQPGADHSGGLLKKEGIVPDGRVGPDGGIADGGAPPLAAPRKTPAQQITTAQPVSKKAVLFSWELRVVWLVVALLGLALLLQLLHFLLPLTVFRFLSRGAHLFVWIGTILLFVLLVGYRVFWLGTSPTQTFYSSLLWFSLATLATHLLGRRRFPQIYVHALPVLVVAIGGLLWALSTRLPTPQSVQHALFAAPLYQTGLILLYASFGMIATAGSWQIIARYLGFWGRRNRGAGYGLQTGDGVRFQLMPPLLIVIGFPVLTLSLLALLLWSIHQFGVLWMVWQLDPRMMAGLFCWFLLGAYLFALRTPKWRDTFAAYLLLVASVGGGLLFIFAAPLVKILQS